METKNVLDTNEKYKEDSQKILEEAESIILKSKGKHGKPKQFVVTFILPAFILIILLFFFSTIFAIINFDNSKILNGIHIQGIDVSNLSVEEAKQKLNLAFNEYLNNDITLSHLDYSFTLPASNLNISYNIEKAVDEAYSIGRTNNIFINNYEILNALLSNLNIEVEINYDPESLNSVISTINEQLPDRVVNSGYYIEDTNLIVTSGVDGYAVDEEALKQELLMYFSNLDNPSSLDIPIIFTKATAIDMDQIYKSVYKAPTDAYYTTNPYVVYPASNGIDFNISIDEAKAMLETPQEQYTIPLKILYPTKTNNDLEKEAFPDLLGSFSTSFKSSNSNRSTNIVLSASKINGYVLMPGETFSFNEVVGQRTAAAGFKPAPAYFAGETVMEYGGGICQVSSTLYNSVLYANLEIVERTNHGYEPSYVKAGLDATVSWGGPEFIFKNNRDYPIKLICETSGKILKIYVYGLKTDNDYTVELDARYLSTIKYSTTYKEDSSLAPGETKVIQSGSNGCKTATYKNLYDKDGNLVSSECISRDTYNPHNQIIAVGK